MSFYTILFILLSISGCKEDDINPVKDVVGHWKWLSTYKVYILSDTNPLTPQNTGIEEILIFKKDGSWFKT